MLSGLQDICKKAGLNSIELVRAIKLIAEPFSIENDLLTPTFKLKRAAVTKYYSTQIKDLCMQIKKMEDAMKDKV